MRFELVVPLLCLIKGVVLSETDVLNVPTEKVSGVPKESKAASILEDWSFKCGDGIRIIAIPDTGFPNGIYPVDGDGYVDLPMIGPLQVTTMSRSSCEKIVRETYIPLVRFSSIQVRRVISISFQGGFQNPGIYWLSPGATLWYALSLSGGTIREDGLKRIIWERDGEIMEQRIIELLKQQKTISELGFKSGDVIRVLARPKRNGWEIFRQDVVPLLSFGISGIVSAITLYEVYQRR